MQSQPVFQATVPQKVERLLGEACAAAGLPARLYWAGNPQLLLRPRISVAGSRKAQGWALTSLEALCGQLVLKGACIVSGGAVGSDEAAHRGALQSGGGTVIILPCPIEHVDIQTWRPRLAPLWDWDRVLLLSPFPARSRVQKGNPIVRNRLIASLAQAAVAGQTALQSGTNHFLGEVRHLGVPTFVLKGAEDDPALCTALATLVQHGAIPFPPERALDQQFAQFIMDAASVFAKRSLAAARAQTSLFDEGVEDEE